jgi:hypothetical protein
MSAIATPPATLREALPELRRPFTPAAIRFKVQATSPKGALVVAYIDARLVIERLNYVCAGDWYDEYDPLSGGLLCKLTVCGVTRQDVGVADSKAEGGIKALYSDALKRAGVKFGIGACMYALPRMWASLDGCRTQVKNGETKIVGLKPETETRLRQQYTAWLAGEGGERFGEPLDHGDAPDAIGDHDAADAPAEPEPYQLPATQYTEPAQTPAPPPHVNAETGEIKPLQPRVTAMLKALDTEDKLEISTAATEAGIKASRDGLIEAFGADAGDVAKVRAGLAQRLLDLAEIDSTKAEAAARYAKWLPPSPLPKAIDDIRQGPAQGELA